MRLAFTIVCLAAACGCGRSSPGPERAATVAAKVTPPPPPPPIAGLPVTMTVKQRSQTVVPGTAGLLTLSIDDITRGKVQTTLRTEKEVVLQPVYLSQGDRKMLDYQSRTYELTLVELNNALIGEDFATFQLTEPSVAAVLTEGEKIDRLIARIESLDGATFVRNGSDHTPAEAAAHLREKREHAGDRLKTADEFIEQIASRSSLTGEEYVIRLADGRTVKAGEFLRDELKRITASRQKPDATVKAE
jgi:hypothetical protein